MFVFYKGKEKLDFGKIDFSNLNGVRDYITDFIFTIANEPINSYSLEIWLVLLVSILMSVVLIYCVFILTYNIFNREQLGERSPVLKMENNKVIVNKDLNVSFKERKEQKNIKEIFLPALLPFIPSEMLSKKKIVYILDSEPFEIKNSEVASYFFSDLNGLEKKISRKEINKKDWIFINVEEKQENEKRMFTAKDLSIKLINNGFKNITIYTKNIENNNLDCYTKEKVLEELESLGRKI